MTAVTEETKTEWPDGILFWPPKIIEYQVDFIARMYLMLSAMLAADTGTGKTVMSLGTAGLAFEQRVIDRVLVFCELNKLDEWLRDFGRFTRIGAAVYHGPKRKRLLGDLPPAVITTYETGRSDLAIFPPKGSRSRALRPGPLMEALDGQRTLIIYDEITKLGNRSSNLYKAHHWTQARLRKAQPQATRALGLSATPMNTGYENVFNELRLVVPHAMPTVAEFEQRVIRSRHPVYGTPSYRPEGVEWFRQLCEPHILRKRKSDPDVRDQFPPFSERFTRVLMHDDQYQLYRTLEDLAWDPETKEHREVPGLDALLRQLAGDPWAVLEAARHGESGLAKMVAEEMAGELEKCSSAKAEQLVYDADLIMSGGGKLLVFTFYGQTVLRALQRRLGDRTVFTYHGGMTNAEREHQKALFKSCRGGAILLASDAASKGINLPEISYCIEYELGRTHLVRQQRAGRGHRLGKEDPLTFISYVLDSSIEGTSSVRRLMQRNAQQDTILGDTDAEDYTTAADRRELFSQARPRKAG